MMLFAWLLGAAAFLCSLVAGFLFAYAIVIMPGIKRLSDADFIRAFQVTDGIIQDNQPLFILVWLGSAVSLIATAAVGYFQLQGVDFWLLVSITLLYLLGVQLLTIVINLPLNARLQQLQTEAMDATQLNAARQAFEKRWNQSNHVRTVIAAAVTTMLLVLLARF